MFDKVKHEPGTKLAVLRLETEVDQRYYFVLLYRWDLTRTLSGQKSMFNQSIKHRKSMLYSFWLYFFYNHEANEEAYAMYYTEIKHSGNVEDTRLRLVFSSFPSCFQMPFFFYQSVKQGLGFFIC